MIAHAIHFLQELSAQKHPADGLSGDAADQAMIDFVANADDDKLTEICVQHLDLIDSARKAIAAMSSMFEIQVFPMTELDDGNQTLAESVDRPPSFFDVVVSVKIGDEIEEIEEIEELALADVDAALRRLTVKYPQASVSDHRVRIVHVS